MEHLRKLYFGRNHPWLKTLDKGGSAQQYQNTLAYFSRVYFTIDEKFYMIGSKTVKNEQKLFRISPATFSRLGGATTFSRMTLTQVTFSEMMYS